MKIRQISKSDDVIGSSYRVLTDGMRGGLSDDELGAAFDDGEVGSCSTVAKRSRRSPPWCWASADEVHETFTFEVFDLVNADLANGAPALRSMAIERDEDGAGSNLVVRWAIPCWSKVMPDPSSRASRCSCRARSTTISRSAMTVGGTANAGRDYVAKNGTPTFAGGPRSLFVDVQVNGDRVSEGAKEF